MRISRLTGKQFLGTGLLLWFSFAGAGCDDDDPTAPRSIPNVSGTYQGLEFAMNDSCALSHEAGFIAVVVSQDAERVSVSIEQTLELEGHVEGSGLFAASGSSLLPGFGLEIELDMFGQFKNSDLRATLIAFGIAGDVVCSSLLNYDLQKAG